MTELALPEIVNVSLTVALNDDHSGGSVVAFRRRPVMSGRSSDAGTIREQIGAILATSQLTLQQVRDNREEAREEAERLWMELRTIKHDENNRQQIMSARLEMADRRSGEIERRIGALEAANRELKSLLSEIEKPVKQMVEFRGRIGWIGGIIFAAGLFLWTVGKPIYDGFIAGWFKGGKT